MDGQRQRNALTAAERALSALGAGKPESARRAAARAAELDQLGVYAPLVSAVEAAAADLESGGSVSDMSWDAVTLALGPGPLAATVAALRGS